MFLSGLIERMNTTHTRSDYWEKVCSRTKQFEKRGQIKKNGVLKMFSNSKFVKLVTFQGLFSIRNLLSSKVSKVPPCTGTEALHRPYGPQGE
jgi:hypothetical protein